MSCIIVHPTPNTLTPTQQSAKFNTNFIFISKQHLHNFIMFSGSNTQGLVQAPRPNTGRKKTEKTCENQLFEKNKNYHKKIFLFRYSFQLCQNIGGNKISATGVSPKWVKSRRCRRKRKEKKQVKNGQLCFKFELFFLFTKSTYPRQKEHSVSHYLPNTTNYKELGNTLVEINWQFVPNLPLFYNVE